MEEQHIIIEEQLLNILLSYKDAVSAWATSPVNSAHFFHQANHHLLAGIRWAYDEKVQLTRTSYKTFVEQFLKTPAEVVAQLTTFNRVQMRVTKRDDLPMLAKQIRDAYIRRWSLEYFKNYQKERDQVGDVEANRQLARKLNSLEIETAETKTTYIDLAESKDSFMADLLERRTNPVSRLKCGIAEIDDTMSVGFKEGTVTLFTAAPGSFKTTIMMNVALNLFKMSGENVLFLPLEMPHEMMMQKLISRETRIPFHKIEYSENLSEDEIRKIGDEFDKWHGLSNRFKMLKIADRAKVSTIRAEIDKRISYFKPRVVFIDYLDNVLPESQSNARDLMLRDLFEDIIRMSEYYGFATVTAAKLSRVALQRVRDQKEGKQELDTTDIHGGQEFGGNATNIFGQLRSQQEPTSKLDFFCIKSRFGQNTFKDGKIKAQLRIDPAIGMIESQSDPNISDKDYEIVKAMSMLNDEEEDTPF